MALQEDYLHKQENAEFRAQELTTRIKDYLDYEPTIPTGIKLQQQYTLNRNKIMQALGVGEEQWQDWKWQLTNRISDVVTLGKILDLSSEELKEIAVVGKSYRWALSPYYASLITTHDPDCPVRKQSLPTFAELEDDYGEDDPMGEEWTSPAPCITRRYPDRLIINVTNQCATYCRHCQRRRNIGEKDYHNSKVQLEAALSYIKANPEIRDVLITGGDALLLSDTMLDWLLGQLHAIPHVEIKRIGTRIPVTMPMRITPELCAILSKYPPIYLNTQFNHPKEITPEVYTATDRLIRAGVVLGNQTVLLKGINDDSHIMKKLNHELLKARIRPYYLFHPKAVRGTSHFSCTIDKGLDIMEHLRGYTSGLAIPSYIVNAPNGGGKTPLLPQYILGRRSKQILLRTWEGKTFNYPN
jgi:glutamate 2,3-aminomutase